jgi:hypothetical protein
MVNPFVKKDPFENVSFSDDEGETGQQQQLSVKEIILRHLRKIGDICCKEFTGGYWTKKPVNTAGGILFIETYNEDVRESYCNAVDFLADMLFPTSDKELRGYLTTNEDIDKEWGDDIKGKLKQKRKTFKEINIMFERVNFWGTGGVGNE